MATSWRRAGIGYVPDMHHHPQLDDSSDDDEFGDMPARAPTTPKLDTFQGETARWPSFMFQFRLFSRGMNDAQRLKHLLGCLRGKAIDFVIARPQPVRSDYHQLLRVLDQRYKVQEEPTLVRRGLWHLQQELTESIDDFADRVGIQVRQAYPTGDDHLIQNESVDHFLRGCTDRAAALMANLNRIGTLQEPLTLLPVWVPTEFPNALLQVPSARTFPSRLSRIGPLTTV